MSIEVKVPVLPESVADATVVTWHKQEGDAVKRDENLVDLETDKVVLEVPAPEDGVLKSIMKGEGSEVLAEEIIAVIEKGSVQAKPVAAEAAPAPAAVEEEGGCDDLSPAVRRMVSEHGLDASKIKGTGKGGRVTKADVEAFMKQSSSAPAPASAKPTPAPIPAVAGERVEKRVPMSRMRARIAERLIEAQQTAALLTTFNEVDMHAVMALRSKYKDSFEKTHDIKLGFMSFFVKASVEALKRFPSVNASIDDKDIVYHGYFDVGVAVSTDKGLVVPVIRDADMLGLADIEKSIKDYAIRAREGKLSMDEMTGGTFSITNGGIFGSLLATPILNPPQSGILGMHNIVERPVAVNGEVVIRPMMYIALTYDHRIIDGKESVQFLKTIKDLLEDPARLLLDI